MSLKQLQLEIWAQRLEEFLEGEGLRCVNQRTLGGKLRVTDFTFDPAQRPPVHKDFVRSSVRDSVPSAVFGGCDYYTLQSILDEYHAQHRSVHPSV